MKVKYYCITFAILLSQNILAQTSVVISNGTGIYIHRGSSFCADTIKVLEGGYYATDDSTGTCEGATIIGDGVISIPVELTSFTATTNGKEVLLNWSTATELNNYGFKVQRSNNNKEFVTIGFVNGNSTTTEQHTYTYADKNLSNGKYYYRLKQMDYDGSYEYSDVVEVEWRAFNTYLLEQNYPNPFNPTTTIGFGVEEKTTVRIVVINAIGEEVAVILKKEMEPGFHQVQFNSHSGEARNLSSGVYFYQLRAGDFVDTKKMLLLK